MFPKGWSFRTVVLEADALAAHDAAIDASISRFEDAYLGLEWLLSRKPDVGAAQNIDGDEWWLHVQSADQIAETPQIWVLYKVTDNEVIIHNLKIKNFSECPID